MPSLSKKAIQMPSSPIRKLVPFAEKAKSLGRKVFHLNIGQPDIETPEVAIEAIRNYSEETIEYSHSAGTLGYRTGLVNYYSKLGVSLTEEQVLVTTGGSEALLFAMSTCLDEGDEIIVPEPFYANYNGFSQSAGVNIVPVSADINNGFALPPISSFEEKITPRTKAIMICNPGNPTGYVYSAAELQQLSEIVLMHDLYLIADEVYREFVYDADRATSVLELKGLESNAIVIDSVSKRYSMCGVRIGALVSKNTDVIAGAMKFAQARLSPPSLGQVAGEAALKTDQSYFDKVKTDYNERRLTLVNGLNNIQGVFCPMPKGAFYCVAKLPVDNAEKFCQWILEHYHQNNQTLMMAPATGFYASPNQGIQEVRLAYVLNTEALKRSLEILEGALAHYPGAQD
jgi:aspartate aminotransferase